MRKIKIYYTNYKGETKEYIITPIDIWFGVTRFHPDSQWILKAAKDDYPVPQVRDFAIKDIHSWEPYNA